MVAEKIYDLLPADIPKVIGDITELKGDMVGIMEYDSGANTEYFGATLEHPVVKIVSRNQAYQDGKEWIERCASTLHKHHDDFFLSIMKVGTSIYLGQNAERMHEFQVVFNIQVEE